MAEVEPAIAHVRCPYCEETIDIRIPVKIRIGDRHIHAEVDHDGWSAQEVWDHALDEHGPKIEVEDE